MLTVVLFALGVPRLHSSHWQKKRSDLVNTSYRNKTHLATVDLFCFTQTVSEAAGQGVTITGDVHRNTWDWANSVIFASTIVTTIGLHELF